MVQEEGPVSFQLVWLWVVSAFGQSNVCLEATELLGWESRVSEVIAKSISSKCLHWFGVIERGIGITKLDKNSFSKTFESQLHVELLSSSILSNQYFGNNILPMWQEMSYFRVISDVSRLKASLKLNLFPGVRKLIDKKWRISLEKSGEFLTLGLSLKFTVLVRLQ